MTRFIAIDEILSKRSIGKYLGQLYNHTFDHLDEISQFFQKHK